MDPKPLLRIPTGTILDDFSPRQPDETSQPYLFGPAGWSYEDWEGRVYPQVKPRPFNPLAYLSDHFDFVEVNTSFYRTPSLKLTDGWVRKTSHIPHFTFWIKLNQIFTHQRQWKAEDLQKFKQSLQPLEKADKLSGLLIQFPYSFHHNSENLAYLTQLCSQLPEHLLAIEFRHNAWNHPEVISLFSQHQWIWVNIDQPDISQNLPLTHHQTHGEVNYVRLHGRNTSAWFSDQGRDARYHYDYSAQERRSIATKIKQLAAKAKRIFISGNNHYKGFAVKNLLQIKETIKSL